MAAPKKAAKAKALVKAKKRPPTKSGKPRTASGKGLAHFIGETEKNLRQTFDP
jgi:hypothetical protein